MFWMTENERYHVTYDFFARTLNLREEDHLYRKIHDSSVIPISDMAFMYPRNDRGSWGKVKGFYSYYAILYRLFRKTLTPRDGNASDITLYQRNFMADMKPGEDDFCVGDFLWQEIKAASENPQKICSYSPYIMYIIRKVTDINYPSDTDHDPLRPKVKAPRVPSPRDDDDEIMAEGDPQAAPQQFEQVAGIEGGVGLGGQHVEQQFEHHEHSPPKRSRSPIKKWLQYFTGICRTQRDIQVAQREEAIKNKKMRDQVKEIYNATIPAPEGVTRSPPSPMPEEWSVPIPSVVDKVAEYERVGLMSQVEDMFNQQLGIHSAPLAYSDPMNFPPSYGNFPGPSHGSYYGMPPDFSYDPYGGQSSSSAPPSDTKATDPPESASVDDIAARASVSIFGDPTAGWDTWQG
jgi:hypothetical protein